MDMLPDRGLTVLLTTSIGLLNVRTADGRCTKSVFFITRSSGHPGESGRPRSLLTVSRRPHVSAEEHFSKLIIFLPSTDSSVITA